MNNVTERKRKCTRFTAIAVVACVFVAALIGVFVLGFNKSKAHFAVGETVIDFSTVNDIPAFVNANSPTYKAHGDITSVYKHNDGWYPSQKSDEVPVEIRTITNAYYYETGKEIPIKIANEVLPKTTDAGGKTVDDVKSTTSTLVYNGKTISIENRAGTVFTASNEYVATFTFKAPAGCTFYYGEGITDDDEIADKNKGLSITQRTPNSFVLTKHWFIVKYASLFVAVDDTANYPYVPFHDPVKVEAAGGKTNIDDGDYEGARGETNTATDTITYTDNLTVKTPQAKFATAKDANGQATAIQVGSIKFDILYVDLAGNKHHLMENPIALGATNTTTAKTLTYYFNNAMPAGHYTLNFYGEIDSSKVPAGDPNEIIGEYWLTVLPKKIDSNKVNAFQTAIQGANVADADASGFKKYFNSYLLSENTIHNDLTVQTNAINGSLNNTLGSMPADNSYWVGKTQYFDSAVTIMYNRDSWSSSNYVSKADIVSMLTAAGTYTIYYSISAKNYITVGGADDAERTNYGFITKLSTGVKVSDIYDRIISTTDPYFKNVTYTGETAKTSVPQDPYYSYEFEDQAYVNVGRYTVTLTLSSANTRWDTTLPDGVTFGDYFALDEADNGKLKVYFKITTAENGWNVMPQMPSWAYNGFDENVNTVTAGLKFNSNVKYALIPTTVTNPLEVEWGIEKDGGTVSGVDDNGIAYFTVDENGKVNISLKPLPAASYYLKYFVDEVYAPDGETVNVSAYSDIARGTDKKPLATVTISKAANRWTATPSITGFAYRQFSADNNFIAGTPLYVPEDKNVYYVIANSAIAEVETLNAFNNITGKHRFILEDTASLSDATVNYFNDNLGKATYYFAVFIPAGNNFTYLFYTGSFSVSQATNNNWKSGTSPDISGWTYNGFNVDLFKTGTPEYGVVKYTVCDVEENPVANYSDKDYDTLKGLLNGLSAGTYILKATSGDTDDYTAVEWRKQFVVAKENNEWGTEPSISNWIYGETHAAPNNGSAKYESATVSGEYYLADSDGNPTGNPLSSVTNAGSYAYVLTVADTTNYKGFTRTLTFTVSRAANSWKTQPASTVTWTYNATNNANIVFEANQNNENLVITLGGETISASSLNTTLKSYGVGTYTNAITAHVPAGGNYDELNATVTLIINRAANGWVEGTQLQIIQLDDDGNETTDWVWGDFVHNFDDNVGVWAPVPQNGTKVIITVKRGGSEQFTAILNYDVTDNDKTVNSNDFDAFVAKLKALNAATYTITAEIPESANYEAYAQAAIEFTVKKATNSWTTPPQVSGWDYSGSTAHPEAVPKYGNKNDVQFSYAATGGYAKAEDVPESKWQAEQPNVAGLYYIRGILPGTDNYDRIVGYSTFNIGAAANVWANMPGVIAWTWGNYKKDINQFSGSARNGGTVKFTITKVEESGDNKALGKGDLSDTSLNEKLLQGFTFVTGSDGKVTKYISDDIAKVLNALKPGTYNLYAVVEAFGSYDKIDGDVNFEIRKANNEWTTAPNMLSYSFGSTVAGGDRQIFTEGKPKYGTNNVSYKITGTENGGAEVYLNNLSPSDIGKLINGEYKVNGKNVILNAGNYSLNAWVSGGDNYEAFYTQAAPYSVLFNISRIENSWDTSNKPKTSIEAYYDDLHKNTFSFGSWFGAPQTAYGDEILYALLNADYTVVRDNVKYGDLPAAIKALPSGNYVIRMTVNESCNCWALTGYTSVSILRYANEFTSPNKNLSGQWQLNGVWKPTDNVNATTLDDFTVTALKGGDTITYTINGVKCETLAKLKEEVAKLNAGSYQVTVAIEQTDSYEGISRTMQLDVEQGKNEFVWSIDSNWTWNNGKGENNHFSASNLKYGNQVSVEINKSGVSAAVSYIVVDLSQPLTVVNRILGGLDAGTYTVTVTAKADEDGNWAEVSDTATFTVDKAENGWTTAPYITGATDNKWEYGAAVIPAAEAKYGSVRFEYATKSGEKLTSMPTACGEYIIKFIVDDSTDYGGINGSLNVTITKANNRNFSVALGVDGWSWGSYDRATNVFKGTPEITDLENAPVRFSVGTGTGDSFVALPGLAEFALNSFGLVDGDSDVEAALNALTGGTSAENNRTTYTLRIHVGETDNYNAFVQDNTFSVTGATNTWTKSPTIVPWIVNHWTDELPSAVALYGAPEIVITRESDGTVYYKGAYKMTEDGLALDTEINNLNLAPEGYYVMTTSVKAEIGHYNSPLLESYRFRINLKGVGEANYWEELPNINGWEANIDGLYNLPVGKPIRGLPNFVFYERNADGTRGQKVDASLSDVVIEKGTKYEADIYIPLEPGNYILVASTKGSPTEDGKSDALAEYEIRVIIDARQMSFEEELRIATLLYLGDRADWADPTSKSTLADAVYDYVYTNKETGESSREKPTKAGKYTVTATISAKYAENVSMSVDFTVELSPNSWVAAPNIKDWSAEYEPNTPTGTASVGSDQIRYTYASVEEPDKILTEIPTTEGSYIMYADLEVEGYEPLHAEYRFTVEPAFDTDLIIVDIILGLIACGLAITVITFAVKKRKLN